MARPNLFKDGVVHGTVKAMPCRRPALTAPMRD